MACALTPLSFPKDSQRGCIQTLGNMPAPHDRSDTCSLFPRDGEKHCSQYIPISLATQPSNQRVICYVNV